MTIYGIGFLLGMALLHQIFAKYLVKERGEPFYLKNTDGIQIGIRFILGIVFYILWSQALYDKIFLWNQLAGREGHLLFYSSSLCQILLTILMEKRGLEELKKKPSLKKNLCCLSVLFMISCLLEVTLFQYRHYESFGNEAVSLPFEGGRGRVNIEGNIWEVVGEEDVYLEVSQLDLDVKNIHIDFLFPKLGETAVKKLPFHFNIRDEGSSAYYELPERVFYHHILQSQYIRLHPYGKCLGVRIYPQLELGEQIEVIKWSFNSQVPAMLSLKRTLFLFMVFSLLFLIRPSSELYQYLYIDKFPFRKLLIVGFALVQIFLFSRIVRWNQFFLDPKEPHHQQYYMLTEALLQGELFLLKPPPEGLIELENPYDYKERLELSQRTGEEIYWDVGYYEGKYFVYFGVGPVLLFYLPYYMLTGSHLPTYQGVFLCSVLLVLAVLAFVGEIIKKWYRNTPFLIYLLLSCLFINGCGALYMIKRPDFYSLPILLALTCTIGGLYFWLSSGGIEEGGRPYLKIERLFLGSLCMAFVAPCRPQLLLGSFFSILLFWEFIFQKRMLFAWNKKGMLATFCFLSPYFVTAFWLMYYNYARFGSVFDFGANYNLTGNAMIYRGFHLDRIPLALFSYLFVPTGFTNRFPFVAPSTMSSSYQGVSTVECLIGGLMYNHVFLIPGLMVWKMGGWIKNKKAYFFALSACLSAIVIIITDAQMAGVLNRYFGDFAWLLMIAAFLSLLGMYDGLADKKARYFFCLVFFCSFVHSMAYQLLGIFTDVGVTLEVNNGLMFYRISHLVEFWL